MTDERLEEVLTTLTEKLAKNGMEASATYKSDTQGNPILRVKALPILPLYAPMESFIFTHKCRKAPAFRHGDIRHIHRICVSN